MAQISFKMQYLVTFPNDPNQTPFLTNYGSEEMFCEGSVVFDLLNYCYTFDFVVWNPIETDHL